MKTAARRVGSGDMVQVMIGKKPIYLTGHEALGLLDALTDVLSVEPVKVDEL